MYEYIEVLLRRLHKINANRHWRLLQLRLPTPLLAENVKEAFVSQRSRRRSYRSE